MVLAISKILKNYILDDIKDQENVDNKYPNR